MVIGSRLTNLACWAATAVMVAAAFGLLAWSVSNPPCEGGAIGQSKAEGETRSTATTANDERASVLVLSEKVLAQLGTRQWAGPLFPPPPPPTKPPPPPPRLQIELIAVLIGGEEDVAAFRLKDGRTVLIAAGEVIDPTAAPARLVKIDREAVELEHQGHPVALRLRSDYGGGGAR